MTQAPPRPLAWLAAVLLFFGAFALYARTARFPFIEFDDPTYVRDNPHLAEGLSPAFVRWAFTSTEYQYNWHPLTWLSHGLDRALLGPGPGGPHLVNALLHALNAALLFLALRALTARPWPSAFAAALFAVHPLRVESVAWIAQRKDVLAGTFFCATLLSYARYARSPSRGRFACVAGCLAAGLMAKPTLVTLPLLLLLLDAWPLERRGVPLSRLFLEKVPLVALSAGAGLLTLHAQHAGGAIRSLSFAERATNALASYGTHLAQLVWPSGLAVFYPHPALLEGEPLPVARALAVAVLALLLFALAWRLRRRAPWLGVGLLWFLGVLAPMIGLVQVGNQAHADRYAYLAQIGLELALVFGIAAALRAWPRWRNAGVALGLAAVALLAVLTERQLQHWRSSEALFEHALAVTERNFVAHNNLGLAFVRDGRMDEALAQFEAAAAARPGFAEAERNVGMARYRRGEFALARAAFERAAAAQPANGEVHFFLASVLFRLGDRAGAARELARALELAPSLKDDPRVSALQAELARQEGH